MSITVDDVADYLEDYHNYGGHGWCLCPFHNDTSPSCSVGEHGFKCWSASCGERGSLEKLYNKVSGKFVSREKTYNPSAWIWKNWMEKYGSYQQIVKEAHQNLIYNPDLGHYLQQRKLDSNIQAGTFGFLEGYYLFPI